MWLCPFSLCPEFAEPRTNADKCVQNGPVYIDIIGQRKLRTIDVSARHPFAKRISFHSHTNHSIRWNVNTNTQIFFPFTMYSTLCFAIENCIISRWQELYTMEIVTDWDFLRHIKWSISANFVSNLFESNNVKLIILTAIVGESFLVELRPKILFTFVVSLNNDTTQ